MSATLTVLGSNSSGNGYLLQCGEEVLILEAGVPVKSALKALDYDIKNVVSVIATHHHGDHLGYCKQYQKYFKVHSTPSASAVYDSVLPLKELTKYRFGGFQIIPMPVPHSVECYAYCIYHPDMGTLVFYTDCSDFKYKIPNVNFILGEINFSDDIILNNLCECRDVRSQYNNHMSLNAGIDVVRRLYSPQLSKVICCHLSDSNADESEIRRRFRDELGIDAKIADVGEIYTLESCEF